MKISDLYKQNKKITSFEIFPPKGELVMADADRVIGELTDLRPDFISVTCSAGGVGGSIEKTASITALINDKYKTASMAHLTCVNSDRESFKRSIDILKQNKTENVFALRGDIAEGSHAVDFGHATDIIPLLKQEGFCVGAACYPEGHLECESTKKDLEYLKLKEDLGADFFLSQLFFDNDSFLRFLDNARNKGISAPIEAGVMPIMSHGQISKMIFMCGASLPSEIIRILNKYKDSKEDLEKAGIEYAAKQIYGLRSAGVDCIHIYTMNKPYIAKGITERLNEKL